MNNIHKVTAVVLLLMVMISTFAQKNEEISYYSDVLSKILSDTEFTARFNISNNNDDSLLVVVHQGYNRIQSRIGSYNISSVSNESEACGRIKNGDIKTVIFLSPIQVVDSVDQFYISIMCYQFVKNGKSCSRRTFSGGFFSTSINSKFVFRFNHSARKWEMEK